MIHSIFFGAAIAACACGVFIGCNNSNPVTPPSSDANPAAPTGATLIYSDGFGGDLSKWETNYMILVSDFYPHMKITTDAAHTGTHSLTSDSCRTALLYKLSPRLETGIAGVEYFIMAKAKGKANFVVEIGQDAGSSGGLFKAFGMGFDPTDFLKCIYYDSFSGAQDSMIGAIEINRWYKCRIEADFASGAVNYFLDDTKIRSLELPQHEMYGIDRMLVFRGLTGTNNATSAEGPKQYYVDDIVLYKK